MEMMTVGTPVPPFGIETADQRGAFKTHSITPDKDAELAFLRSKLHMMETHPALDEASRNAARHALLGRRGLDVIGNGKVSEKRRAAIDEPVPGGVGHGMFFTEVFKTAFVRGTSLYWEAVCPSQPGGNVNTWLYVTAMNRAGRGCEAYVSYQGQTNTRFRVYDWAREDRWQIETPFGNLSNYLRFTTASNGAVYQVLPIWNSTYEIGNQWRNEVMLHNHLAGRWDLVYRFDYDATSNEQSTTAWTGSWGPIVETFQETYTGTNPLGVLNTGLISAASNGTWGQWQLLGANDSSVRNDGLGYTTVFLEPNHSWTVVS